MGAVSPVLRRRLSLALLGFASTAALVSGCGRKEPTAAAPASGDVSAPPPRGSAAPSAATGSPGPHDIEIKATGWGRGTITVTPDAGLACEDFDESQDFMQICKGQVAAGEMSAVITMTPAPGASLGGWVNGPCAGTMAPSCTIPMNQDQSIVVAFQLGSSLPSTPLPAPAPNSVRLGIDLLGSGTGTITAAPDIGLVCVRSARSNVSATCSAQVPAASLPLAVTLQATPDGSSSFSGWGASCSGSTGASCSLTIKGVVGVTAGFLMASPGTSTAPLPGPTSLAISPASLNLDACQGYAFRANVPAGTDARVTWSVEEAGGGSVANGVYMAPIAPGTYHVVARSQVSPAVQSVATVTVGPEKVRSVTISPGSGRLMPGGGMKLSATVTTSCGTFQAN
jgi:hypothetical protein